MGTSLFYDVVDKMALRLVITVSCPTDTGTQQPSCFYIFFSPSSPEIRPVAALRPNQNSLLSSCTHGGVKTSGLFGCEVMPACFQFRWADTKTNSDDGNYFVRASPGLIIVTGQQRVRKNRYLFNDIVSVIGFKEFKNILNFSLKQSNSPQIVII